MYFPDFGIIVPAFYLKYAIFGSKTADEDLFKRKPGLGINVDTLFVCLY